MEGKFLGDSYLINLFQQSLLIPSKFHIHITLSEWSVKTENDFGLESEAFTDQDETNQMGYASGHLPWRLPKLIPSDGRFACDQC